MTYRVYLFDEQNRIAAAETFMAADDHDARGMAALLFRSARDAFSKCELWCGSRRVLNGVDEDALTLDELAEDRQRRMLDLEERLMASFGCIRRSQNLLAAVDQLLAGRGANGRLDAPLPGETLEH